MALFRSSALQTSPSSSSFSASRFCYDVFLSFRGEDTRRTFTDHLYTALDNANFRTFRDNDELERGEDIKPGFMKAIQQSRSSIIVFSKDYACSRWCLNELVMIFKEKRTSGHVVLPVFYDVIPSDVRNQTGSLATAFSGHEKTQSVDTVKEWKEALSEAADLAGMVLHNEEDGYESRFIMKIVKVIEDKLRRMPGSGVDWNLIGMPSRVEDINLWLRDGTYDVGILVIYGMRGIGKTTIARYVYESNLGRFERHSFVENIREIAGQSNGLIQIQKQLLHDISSGRKVEIHNVREGIARIGYAVRSKRVLLVLDDVDCTDHLDGVIRVQDQLYPGSKIIITTNNAGLLNSFHQVVKVHVQTLNCGESLELLSLYAFGQHHPPVSYMDLSKRLVEHCEGLPLALKILASSLSGKSIAIWESALKKLKVIPNGQILEKLKISYDSLQVDDQDLFLHIACFFVGMDKDIIVTMLSNYDCFPDLGIDTLMGRYLLTVNKCTNKMEMHNMIRDMGRDIVHLESKEPGERSRLWYHMDSFKVLTEENGTEAIVGLVLNMQMHPDYVYSRNSNGQVVLETDAFLRMRKLRFLELSCVQLEGSYKGLPTGLRWLCWPEFPLFSIPSDFSLKSLVVLEMCYSSLTHIWKGTKCLKSLKILNVSHSRELTETPDFSLVPNLERLILEDCASLVDVHDSIGRLKRLVHLNMKHCISIRKLPKNICLLSGLETFIISGCSNLNEFQFREEIDKMESLKVFDANGVPIHRLFITTEEVQLPPRQNVEISLASYLPHRLENLRLESCNLSDDDFPADLGNLPFLRILDLGHNPIRSLPAFVRGLPGLQRLLFYGCWRLKSLVRLPTVGYLALFGCKSLARVTFQSFRDYSRTVVSSPPHKLAELEYRYKVGPIESVNVEMLDLLGLSNLKYSAEINMLGIFSNSWFLCDRPRMRRPIQGLFEFGIFSTFLPGNEVPSSFSHKTEGSSISFTVPLIFPDNLRIRGFNFFSIYTIPVIDRVWDNPICAEVSNKSKDLKWRYYPRYVGVPDEGQDIIWLSHWMFGNKLEPGDELTFSAFAKFDLFVVKECGIQVVYEEEEAMMSAKDNTTNLFYPNIITGDLSKYLVSGTYELRNG